MVSEKFGNEEQTPWFGRFIVTLNTDHDSMMILPELNNSVHDKFIYLLAAAEGTKKYAAFGERDENEARIRAELPIFARYLLDMPLPGRGHEHFDIRFGFKAWQHPIMVERCMTDESCEAVLDAMDMAFSALPPRNNKDQKVYWEGSATELYMCLAETGGDRGNECFRNAIRSNMRTFGKMLAKIRDMGYDIKDCGKNGRGNTKWRVFYGIVTEAPPEVKKRAEAAAGGLGNFNQTEEEKENGNESETSEGTDDPRGEDVDDNVTEEVLPVQE
jgi:hypothetical protein